jgi:hypothetical protein
MKNTGKPMSVFSKILALRMFTNPKRLEYRGTYLQFLSFEFFSNPTILKIY